MRSLRYPQLWQGCVGAWCPSQDRSRSTHLTDFSGYGNHGTLTNMDPGTDWVASQDKVALDFDGSNDHVAITKCNTFQHWTVSSWVFITANPASIRTIFNKGENTNRDMSLDLNTSAIPRLYFTTAPSTFVGFTGSIAVPTNTWTNVIGTYDKSTMRLFVAGVAAGTYATTATPSAPDTAFLGSLTASLQLWLGRLDDARIYNRALSPSEIALLASRRGVAYETKRMRIGKQAAAASSNKNNMLMGIGF